MFLAVLHKMLLDFVGAANIAHVSKDTGGQGKEGWGLVGAKAVYKSRQYLDVFIIALVVVELSLLQQLGQVHNSPAVLLRNFHSFILHQLLLYNVAAIVPGIEPSSLLQQSHITSSGGSDVP